MSLECRNENIVKVFFNLKFKKKQFLWFQGSHREKLIELNLQSLESRKLRYDLIETYKIIQDVNNVDNVENVRGFQS